MNIWSEKETQILKTHFKSSQKEEILNLLPNRTWDAIETKARKQLKIKRDNLSAWTDEETLLLKENHSKSAQELSLLFPRRTLLAIEARIYLLGYQLSYKESPNFYTEEEDKYLIDNYKTLDRSEISRHLKRSEISILDRASRLGLKMPRKNQEALWTKEEDKILFQYYKTNGPSFCEKFIQRSKQAMKYRANCLGIKIRVKPQLTQQEKSNIEKLHGKVSTREIARQLNLQQYMVREYLIEGGKSNGINYGVAQKQYLEEINKYRHMSGVYYVKNLDNNRFYIGVSLDIRNRMSKHICELSKNRQKNTEWQSDWNLGHKFKFGIITDGPKDMVELTKLEYQLILLNKENSLCYNKNSAHTEINISEEQKERFFSKISKTDSCWIWVGKTKEGYGLVNFNSKQYFAHRISYFIHKKENPGPLLVCHTCDNPSCVNPEHLFLGSDATNSQDRQSKGKGGRPWSMSEEDRIKIRQMFDSGKTRKEIAQIFNVKYCTIYEYTK